MERPVRIAQFLDETGKIQKLPRKQAARYEVLAYLASHFEADRIYAEWEVNAVCGEWHTFGDYFLLRRELVESGLLCRKRDGSAYWKAPDLSDKEEQSQSAAQPIANAETGEARDETP